MDEQRKPIEMPSADVADYSNEINAMYDAQRQSQEAQLKSAYDSNVQTLQNSRAAIAPVYNQKANDLAAQYERTRRNNNMRADMNGLNTGTASQMDLAQQSNYLDAFSGLRTAQAQAEQAVDQKLADLEIGYKNAVSEALAQNDYQRAAALMEEYKRRDNATKDEQRYQYDIRMAAQKYEDAYRQQQEQDAWKKQVYADETARQQEQDALSAAKTRAAYGDFSGYASVYGQDVANAMQQYWIYSNPDYAYATGMMSADDYYRLTGQYPASAAVSSSSSSGGGGNGNNRLSKAKQAVDAALTGQFSANGSTVIDPSLNDVVLGDILTQIQADDAKTKNDKDKIYNQTVQYAKDQGATMDDKYKAYLAAETAARRNAAAKAQSEDRKKQGT